MKDRIKADEARDVARLVMGMIRPGCVRLEIAGSLRRGCEYVSDVELVAQPRIDIALNKQGLLFEDEYPVEDRLTSRLDDVLNQHGLLKRAIKNGPKYKQLVVDGIKVDLFIVLPPAQFGCIYTIRTGPAEFSKLLVTRRYYGGAMPSHLVQKQGSLWEGETQITTPTERDYFRALGIRYIEPHQRSLLRLRSAIEFSNSPRGEVVIPSGS